MENTKLPAMPDAQGLTEKQASDGLSSAIVKHIEDDINDGQTLRAWRPWLAAALLSIAVILYATLLYVIRGFATCSGLVALATQAQVVAVAVIATLAVIPTLIIATVARAVFGKRTSSNTPYAPLQAIIHLMKEMKGD